MKQPICVYDSLLMTTDSPSDASGRDVTAGSSTPNQAVTTPPLKANRAATIIRRVRWLLAVLITVGSVSLAVASYWLTPLQICRDTLVSSSATTRAICAPWSTLDLVPLLILPLVLIFPELGELTVMNILSLKRKTEEQQAEIDTTKARQNDLELRILSQIASLNANQSLTQHFYQGPGDAAKIPEEVEKEETIRQPPFSAEEYVNKDDPHADEEDQMRQEMESMIVDLLHQWDMIDTRTNPSRGLHGVVMSPEENAAIRNFNTRHAGSMSTIRKVRNSVAHGRWVSYDDLRGAAEGARRLNSILDGFNIPPF